MKVAALYDIHGNLPALEAVLKEIEQLDVKEIVVGGDVVLGPMSNECLDRLLSIKIPAHFIQGNCEAAILSELAGNQTENLPERVLKNIQWTANELRPSHEKIISGWPEKIILEIDGLGKVLFCHATPRSKTENFTRLTPVNKLKEIFEEINEPYVVCGHTHMQFEKKVGNVRILNAGSIGMPFGKPGAYWLLLGTKVEFRYTAYNIKKASEVLMKSKYPDAEDFALNNLINPPSEELMLKVLSNGN